MDKRKFNKGNKGNKGGRKRTFANDKAKAFVLNQSFYIIAQALKKDSTTLTEKEKIEIAKQLVLKEIGKNIDLTSKGDKLEITPIYAGKAE